MAARVRRSRRRGRSRRADSHENQDRWLLTYADMITLLMALFMVLFSMSTVSVSKFESLKLALKAAFSPSVLEGAGSVVPQSGGARPNEPEQQQPVPTIVPLPAERRGVESNAQEDAEERDEFLRLKRLLDAYARSHGFRGSIETLIRRRGLVIRVLTDRVLFDSGSANLKPESWPLLEQISRLLNLDTRHPISVEGHTDTVPISTSRFPSNWELSAARASSVVRFLIAHGVSPARLEATGLAGLRPVATNLTATGRSRNRRVEIVLMRIGDTPEGGPLSP